MHASLTKYENNKLLKHYLWNIKLKGSLFSREGILTDLNLDVWQ